MGFRIFSHSVGLVFGQLNGALRISGVLYLVSLVFSAIAFFFMPSAVVGEPARFAWQFPFFAILACLPYLWIAVGWHRFVLLDELPDAPVPAFHGSRLLAYFGRGVQAALICAGVGLVLGVAYTLLAGALRGASSATVLVGVLIMTTIALAIILLVAYRLAPIFPGAATGRPVSVSAAWTATSGASGTLLAMAFISAIASIVIDLPMQLLQFLPAGLWLVFIWAAITGWIKLMVGVSILTTIYGVYVEKRTIT